MGFHEILIQIVLTTSQLGYLGIFILMAIESSVLPIPSELALIPAGVLVASGEFSFTLLVIVSIAGSIFGSLLNYYIAYFLGRRGFDKFSKKYPLILSQNHLEKSENYFKRNGEITVFVGRFVPVVRHLISLPAGFAKMDLGKFCLYTGVGAGIWATILIYIGYFFNDLEPAINRELELFLTMGALLLTAGILIWIALRKNKTSA